MNAIFVNVSFSFFSDPYPTPPPTPTCQNPTNNHLLLYFFPCLIILIIHYMDVHHNMREKKKKIFCCIAHLSGTKTALTNSSLCIHTVGEMVSVISPLSIHTECKVIMALFSLSSHFGPLHENFVWLFNE